jgi:hypothetical protein
MNAVVQEAFDVDSPDGAPRRIARLLELRRKRRKTLETIRDHPEWLAGTSAFVGDDLVPSWEERNMVWMERMAHNGIVADLCRINQAGSGVDVELPDEFQAYGRPLDVRIAPLRFNRKHAWYDAPEKHVPLEVTVGRDEVWFRSTPGPAPWSDLPSWAGVRKVHWAVGGVRDARLGTGQVHLVELDAKGQSGRLVVRVHAAAGRSIGREAMVVEDFPASGASIRKRIAVAPASDQPEVPGAMKIYVEWQPHDDEAPLEGACRVRQVSAARGPSRSSPSENGTDRFGESVVHALGRNT